MADYKHGEMDVTAQQKTFDGFIKMVVRASVIIIALVIFMALANG